MLHSIRNFMVMQNRSYRTNSTQYLVGIYAPFLYTVQFLNCHTTRNFFSWISSAVVWRPWQKRTKQKLCTLLRSSIKVCKADRNDSGHDNEWGQCGHGDEPGDTWMLVCLLAKLTGCRSAIRQANTPRFTANVWNEHVWIQGEDEKRTRSEMCVRKAWQQEM